MLSSTALSFDLCCHNSFHWVFVLSSHHITVPSQSGLLYFVRNACHSQHLSDDPIPYLILEWDPKQHHLLLLLLLQWFYIAPLQDCLLRSVPSPASVKQNGLEGREERDGVINRYLAKSGRKPIPGHRTSNREGMALPSDSPRARNNKFHFLFSPVALPLSLSLFRSLLHTWALV